MSDHDHDNTLAVATFTDVARAATIGEQNRLIGSAYIGLLAARQMLAHAGIAEPSDITDAIDGLEGWRQKRDPQLRAA